MISAHIVDGGTITATYSQSIAAISFVAGDFTTEPGENASDVIISQIGTVITLDFPNDISFDTSLVYSGSATGIQTPDSVNLT